MFGFTALVPPLARTAGDPVGDLDPRTLLRLCGIKVRICLP
jgi:hypothetical protein